MGSNMAADERCGLVDAQIRAARERGDFDGLPGRGKPLELNDVLPSLTPDEHFEALLLRTLGELPPEVALVREIRACRKALDQGPSPAERARLQVCRRSKLDELCALLKEQKK
jgi:hypothetical protein